MTPQSLKEITAELAAADWTVAERSSMVYEMATQIAVSEGLERQKAQEVADAMIKGLAETEW